MESAPIWYVIAWGFGLAVFLGIMVHKTNFCTMGAISDWVNMGDKGRMFAWLLAIAVAISGVLLLEGFGVIELGMTMPPYRSANFAWLRYLLGGLMFGVGMTLAGGCVNKTLIRIGGGNMKSLLVLLVGGIFAFLMTRTDFYHYGFHIWMDPLTINLQRFDIDSQQITTLIGGLFGVADSGWFHNLSGGLIALALLFFIFRSADFRSRFDNFLGGTVVGLVVVAGWYITAGPLGQEAVEAASFMDNPPIGVGAMSFTFVNPMGETLYYLVNPLDLTLITFGIAILVGVIVGSFVYALFTGNLRLEWFNSIREVLRFIIGGILMGIGGVLAMGCTFGQGITGFSTLALGSMIAFASFILGCAATMKIEYYRMVYDDAGFKDALLAALADLRLLPRTSSMLKPVD
ncbi:MAG: YeeE/YedE family protein [Gammaproteobacteria bacterium]|nr:MAG: YeeE/YedE family protein [Gammaproteobacteria bacterium]